jgi:restriction endonuclease S subunit
MANKTARLGDLATYINGYTFKPADWGDTGLPIIRIQDLTGNSYQLNRYDGEYPERIEVNDGDVLISWSASLGVYVWQRGKALLNQHIFKVVFDKLPVNKDYFVFAVEHKLAEMESKTHGATMKHIVKKDFDGTTIPYPPIEKQAEIADHLRRITSLIDRQTEQLLLLDQLVKSRFIELFGDPELNPRGLPVLPWNAVFQTTTGKLDSNAMVENGRYPFFTCAKESYKIDSYAFDCEALLLAGNNAAGIYDVKHYKGKFNAYQRTYVLRLMNEKWSYILFKRQLEDKLRYLQSQSKGTNTRYLTLGILNELRFVVPPIAEQEQFAAFVEQTDKSKLCGKMEVAA